MPIPAMQSRTTGNSGRKGTQASISTNYNCGNNYCDRACRPLSRLCGHSALDDTSLQSENGMGESTTRRIATQSDVRTNACNFQLACSQVLDVTSVHCTCCARRVGRPGAQATLRLAGADTLRRCLLCHPLPQSAYRMVLSYRSQLLSYRSQLWVPKSPCFDPLATETSL